MTFTTITTITVITVAFLFSVFIVIISKKYFSPNKKMLYNNQCVNPCANTGKNYKRVFIVVLVNKKKYVVMTKCLKIPNCPMKKGETAECCAQQAFNEICGFALDNFTRIGYLSYGNNFVLVGKTNNIIYDDDKLNIHLVSTDDIIIATVPNIKTNNIFRILNDTTCNFTNFTFDTCAPNYSYINYTP